MTKKVTMAKGVEEKESTTHFEEDNSHQSLLKQTNTGETVAKNEFKGDDDDAESGETTEQERIPFVEKSPDMEGKEDESGSKNATSCWICKYNWRCFLPVACCCRSPDLSAYENAGFLEIASASFATDVVKKGFKTNLQSSDLGKLSKSLQAEFNLKRFMRFYEDEKAKTGTGGIALGKIFWRTIRTKFVLAVLALLSYLTAEFVMAAVVLQNILLYVENPSGSVMDGMIWVLLLPVLLLCRALLVSSAFLIMLRAGIAARAMALSLIYRKLSRLKSVGSKSIGELVNLCANDAQRIFECCQFCIFVFSAPFLTILMSVYMYLKFGPSSLIGLAVMILFLPIQALLGKLIGKIRAKVIVITDKRVKMINEVITCIKLIKMYAWEKSFSKVIADLRSKEKNLLVGLLVIQAINMSMGLLLTSIAPVATFAAHIAFGNDLSVSEAFTVIAMFNIYPPAIALLPIAVRGISESLNAMKRLKNLMGLEEFVPYTNEPSNSAIALSMEKCDFAWVVPEDENDDKKKKKKLSKDEVNGQHVNGHSKNAHKNEEPKVEFKKGGKGEENGPGIKGLTHNETKLSPTLFDINLAVEKGSLIGICGAVGSGKSSLIQAVLGQMNQTAGKVEVIKSIAYVSQQAWIMNETIRNNITFGKEYDEKRYKECCAACALDKDLDGFESGDLTEIGERGINLSGGQKQRVSLARALYADADLYLLDDPLSAVDAHVGQFIFENFIQKELKGKTCMFVTHQLQYLKDCNEVILMANGRMEEKGTYSELMSAHKEFSHMIQKFKQEKQKERTETIDESEDIQGAHLLKSLKEAVTPNLRRRRTNSLASSAGSEINLSFIDDDGGDVEADDKEKDEEKIKRGKIIEKEESSVGSVSWKVYSAFMKASGGFIISILGVFMQMSVIGIVSFVEWWLSKWLTTAEKPVSVMVQGNMTMKVMSLAEHPETPFFMTMYIAVGSSIFLIQTIASMILVSLFMKASTNMHNQVLESILKCPMRFYDTTPTGRILNRFSRDLDELDGRLPWTTETFIRNATRILLALGFIAGIFPWFLIAVLPLAILFYFFYSIFRRTNRETKRIDNSTRSPVFSHLTATVQGLPTLRAYNKIEHFQKTFDKYVDNNSMPLFMFFLSGRWFGVRLDFICIILSTVTAVIAVTTTGSAIPPALAGLAIVYSLKTTGLFQFTCRLAAETESRFTSVERMNHYATALEHEGPFEDGEQPSGWPSCGRIEFINVQLRYRPNLPLVLKDVSFSIKSKEKIGIAGRTGSGKSSLAVALFRLVEIDGGQIFIDNQDTSQIGLTILRSGLSVIPQDPVLFIGTLRYNLDPFNIQTDEELWLALEKAHMKDTVANFPLKLETLVVENGENFSVGERQLICMARALVRNSKILILDEATAAVDTQTDSKIQLTIREAFKDCTVLTIAHRLNTIMECDRVLVMDSGEVSEFDTPSNLLSRDSKFFKMVKSSSLAK